MINLVEFLSCICHDRTKLLADKFKALWVENIPWHTLISDMYQVLMLTKNTVIAIYNQDVAFYITAANRSECLTVLKAELSKIKANTTPTKKREPKQIKKLYEVYNDAY